MTTGNKAARVVFLVCDFIFLLMGVGIFIAGIYLKVSRSDFTEVLDSREFNFATALMVSAGIIVVVVAVIGLIGERLQNQCVLGVYLICVILIFCMELAAGITGAIYRNKIEEALRGDMLTGLQNSGKRNAWDTVQERYECCGVHNASDWNSVFDPRNPSWIPDSCCGFENCGTTGTQVAWTIGCFDDAKEWLEMNYLTIVLVAIIEAVLQVILIIMPIVLIYFIRREKKYRYM
ncbi:tetraspanin-9-like [Argopecten irradians]|uniref:tetraspanin-9-like n=1 Tax=Argopecten irradians TaxID=31199 RepID=UPI00371237BC